VFAINDSDYSVEDILNDNGDSAYCMYYDEDSDTTIFGRGNNPISYKRDGDPTIYSVSGIPQGDCHSIIKGPDNRIYILGNFAMYNLSSTGIYYIQYENGV
jgi:hypothetical protein